MDDHTFLFSCHGLLLQVSFLFQHLSVLFRIGKAKWIHGTTGYATYGELVEGFYGEAATHLPFVLPIHNLWRAKQLNDLNYGKRNFRMRDSAKVEKILSDAGKGSAVESTYEAGPQSVTQVPLNKFKVTISLTTGGYNFEYGTIQQHPAVFCLHLNFVPFLGSCPLFPHYENSR